jgi:uncharacterized protein (TIGR02453 family)
MPSPFTAKTLSFLRALKRNNDREWFRARKHEYEQHVRGPMLALLQQLGPDLRSFAPELVCDPKVSLYRIYRDTRFSDDKSPLKTHVAAHFPMRGFPRGTGGGLYFEIAPQWVWIGGGIYMPSSTDLRAIRAHIADTHPQLHRLVLRPAFARMMGGVTGAQLTRVPVGYAKDHPAAEYLRYKQFLASRERDAAFATSPRFYRELVATFRATAPLVQFLNTALVTRATAPPVLTGDARSKPQRPEPMW